MVRISTRILTIALISAMVLGACYPLLANASTSTEEWTAEPMHRTATQTMSGPAGYAPSDVYRAYNLPGLGGTGGAGNIIAIIDAYSNPSIVSDFAAFSQQFGITTGNLVIYPMSTTIGNDAGWGLEEALDVEWAHAIAPQATILLVEAKSNSIVDLMAAVDYATTQVPGVVSVSMSWGAGESSQQLTYDSHFTGNGITFFASSGDNGAGVIWPSSSVNVVSVGGTTLTTDSTGKVISETAWSGSGGGVSLVEPKPSYQASLTSYSRRATPDVSYDANPSTGFSVLDTSGYGGWVQVGGTSAGAPQWAAIKALSSSVSNTNFYAVYNSQSYSTDFRDITQGSNGYPAKTGYDLVTGIGSPLTTNFVTTIVPDFTISASPNPVALNTATTNPATTTITVSALNGFSGSVSLAYTTTSSLTATFDAKNPIAGSGSSVLTITAPPGISAGTYTITVTGTSGAIVHTATVNVQVTTPDFSLTAASKSLTIRSGSSSVQTTITLKALNGFNDKVAMTYLAPSGVVCTFNPSTPVTPSSRGTSITLTITAPRGTTSTITIIGTDTTATWLSHSVVLTVTRR